MKKEYERAEIQVVAITSDVITNSNTLPIHLIEEDVEEI
jgi:hypothetical protein